MSDSGTFAGAFILGFFFFMIIASAIRIHVDVNYEYHKWRLERIEMLCSKLDSTPASFDEFEVECANGVQISYGD